MSIGTGAAATPAACPEVVALPVKLRYDCGSRARRPRREVELAAFAAATGLRVTVAHLPLDDLFQGVSVVVGQ